MIHPYDISPCSRIDTIFTLTYIFARSASLRMLLHYHIYSVKTDFVGDADCIDSRKVHFCTAFFSVEADVLDLLFIPLCVNKMPALSSDEIIFINIEVMTGCIIRIVANG